VTFDAVPVTAGGYLKLLECLVFEMTSTEVSVGMF
jgi:hypothetical protein